MELAPPVSARSYAPYGTTGIALSVKRRSFAWHQICSYPHEEPSVQRGYSVQTDLNVRIFDGGDEHCVPLHHLSAVDDFAATSMPDTGVIGRLLATVPDGPFSAAVVNGTYIPADKTRQHHSVTLLGGPHDEVPHAWCHSHIASWSREYGLNEETGTEYARITTWVFLGVFTPRVVVLPFG